MTKTVYPWDAGALQTHGDGPYPFSKAIRAGDFVFLSGQIAWGEDGLVINGGIEDQTRQTWLNIKRTLEEVGCSLGDIVKATIWLQDPRDFAGYNKVYAEFFPTDPPTRATVSANLIFDFKVEIEVVAYRPLDDRK